MKTIATILVAFAATLSLAQEQSSSAALPATNIIKSPIIMKGLYGTRSRSSTNAPARMTENAVMDALRMFRAKQNEDGSWGVEDRRRLATPLVLLALLAHGETRGSHEFGDTIARAHQYVLTCDPTNDAERISSIIALSEYVAIHVASDQRDLAKVEVGKIQAMLSAVQNTADNPWVQYLTFHHLPQEIPRPDWLTYTREFPKRWSDVQVNVAPETLDEYLALRVAGLAKFRVGGKVWGDFNHQFAPKMRKRQTPDGFYPSWPETDRFACTALAVQAIEVYYAWQPHYYAPPEPEKKDKDIEVKIQ